MTEPGLSNGSVFAGYRIQGLIEQDGDVRVYRAAQAELGRQVRLHVTAVSGRSEAGAAFLSRATRLVQLEHPHIVPVYEAGEAGGRAFAATASAPGRALADALADGPLEPRAASAIVAQVASAIDALERADADPAALALDQLRLAGSRESPEAYLDIMQATVARERPPGGSAPSTSVLAQLTTMMVTGRDTIDEDAVRGLAEPLRAVLTRALSQDDPYPSPAALAQAVGHAVALSEAPRTRRRAALLALVAAAVAIGLAAILVAQDDESPSPQRLAPSSAPAARLTATIPINAKPVAVAFGEGSVWMTTEQGTLVRVDARAGQVTGTPIRLGARAGAFPLEVGAGSVWTHLAGDLIRIDPVRARVTGRRRMAGEISAITVAGAELWISRAVSPGPSELLRLEPSTLRTIGRPIRLRGRPEGIAAEGRTAWVTSDDGTVTRLDTRGGTRDVIRVGGQASDAELHRGSLWVAVPSDGTLLRVNAPTLEVANDALHASHPFTTTVVGDDVWTVAFTGPLGGPTRLYRVDARSGRIAGRPVNLGRGAARVTAGSGALWVPSPSRRALLKLVPTSPAPAPAPGAPAASEAAAQELVPGPLGPGTWRAPDFPVPFTLELRERGWLHGGAPGLVTLARSDRPDMFVTVAAPRRLLTSAGRLSQLASPAGAFDVLAGNPRLRVGRRRALTVGGRRGLSARVQVHPGRRFPELCGGSPCVPVFPFEGGTYILDAAASVRLYALRAGRAILIFVEVPQGSPASDFDLADAVVRTLRFGE